MPPLSADQMLAAWERGRAEPHPAAAALALLAAAHPESAPTVLAGLSIGERDRLLLDIREHLFGSRLAGLAPCAVCGETLEAEFDLPRVEAHPTAPDGRIELRASDFEVTFRLPDSRDLLAIAANPTREVLLERLVLSATRSGVPAAFSDLPGSLLDQIEDAMEAADPQADVLLNLTCQSCGNRWQVPFDIVSFLRGELEAWAIRLLREVHILACSYGWSETEILNMSPWRRHCYMEMLGE